MKIQVSTNTYQAQRNWMFKGRDTTTTLKTDITIQEGYNLLQEWAVDSGCNNTILENGDVFDMENEYVVYSYGTKSFSDDGYYYQLLPNGVV